MTTKATFKWFNFQITGFRILLILISILLSQSIYANDFVIRKAARDLVNGLCDQLTKNGLQITLGSLLLENTNISSEFSNVFLNNVEYEFKNRSEDVVEVIRNIGYRGTIKMRGITRYSKGFSNFNEEETKTNQITPVIFEGHYRNIHDTLFVYSRLVQIDGTKIAEQEVKIPLKKIGYKIKPDNNIKIKQAVEEIQQVSSRKNDFNTHLWFNNSNGIYKEGEEVLIWFKTDRNCYLKVIDFQTDGKRVVLYPTERDSKEVLQANRVYDLHKKNVYSVVPPFGTEIVMSFCRSVPWENHGEIEIGGGHKGFEENISNKDIVSGYRTIKPSAPDAIPEQSEVTVYLTTVPK